MHATLEYIGVTIAIIFIILIAQYSLAVFLRDTAHVREEQLYTIAERIMDKIVLTPGDPPDWGHNFTAYNGTLRDFGLAQYGTRTPYELDPDKIMRLANLTDLPNPLFINGSYIAELLGLSDKYGFVLEMRPLLSHEVTVLDYYPVPGKQDDIPAVFQIKLKNYYGLNVPSANVTGIYTLIKVEPGIGNVDTADIEEIFTQTNITNLRGECILDFTEDLEDFFKRTPPGQAKKYLAILLIHTNWYGFVAVDAFTSVSGNAPATGYVVGDYIILEKDIEVLPRSAILVKDEVIQAVPEYRSLLTVVAVNLECNGTSPPSTTPACYVINSGRFQYKVYRVEYVEKLSSHIFVIAQWRGEYIAIVIDRIPKINIRYGTYYEPVNSVVLIREGHLFNYPYVVKLTIWRVTEG